MSDAIDNATAALRAIHRQERQEMCDSFDGIEALVSGALLARKVGDIAACHRLCKKLLDAEYELLGDCYSEDFCELLGYVDPEPEHGVVLDGDERIIWLSSFGALSWRPSLQDRCAAADHAVSQFREVRKTRLKVKP